MTEFFTYEHVINATFSYENMHVNNPVYVYKAVASASYKLHE